MASVRVSGKSMGDYEFKLMLIGHSGVGKTAMISRYADDKFNSNWISTIGIDFKMKNVTLDGQRLRIQIWDTAGQERYQSMAHSFYRGASGVLLVYDVTSTSSFNDVNRWMKNIKTHGSSDVKIVLAGNKSDLKEARSVSKEMGEKLASEFNCKFFETSAKEGNMVDDCMNDLALQVIRDFMKNRVKQTTEDPHLERIHCDKPDFSADIMKLCCRLE